MAGSAIEALRLGHQGMLPLVALFAGRGGFWAKAGSGFRGPLDGGGFGSGPAVKIGHFGHCSGQQIPIICSWTCARRRLISQMDQDFPMTLSGTNSVSPAFGAGIQAGPVFSPAVLTGGSRPTTELAKTDSTTSGAGAPVSTSAVSGSPGLTKSAGLPSAGADGGPAVSLGAPSASAASPGGAAAGTAKATATSSATASAEASRAAEKAAEARNATKSAPVGEDGQIRELRSQGQNLSQIAVDLNISVAAVNGDLQTDIPKFVTPPPVVESSSDHSTISVFA